jgi:hypothetical protein
VACICGFQVRTHPGFDIGHLWPVIAGCAFAGAQLGEADAEAQVVDICLGHDVVCDDWHWRVFEEFQQSLAGLGPSLNVLDGEGLRVCEGLGEGYDGELALQGTSELLSGWEDDGEVDWDKDGILNAVGVFDEEIST